MDAIIDDDKGVMYVVSKSTSNVFIHLVLLEQNSSIMYYAGNYTQSDPLSVALLGSSLVLLRTAGVVNVFSWMFSGLVTFATASDEVVHDMVGSNGTVFTFGHLTSNGDLFVKKLVPSLAPRRFQLAAGTLALQSPSALMAGKSLVLCGSVLYAIFRSANAVGMVSLDALSFERKESNMTLFASAANLTWSCYNNAQNNSLLVAFPNSNTTSIVDQNLQVIQNPNSLWFNIPDYSIFLAAYNTKLNLTMNIEVNENNSTWVFATISDSSSSATDLPSSSACSTVRCGWDSLSDGGKVGVYAGIIGFVFLAVLATIFFVVAYREKKITDMWLSSGSNPKNAKDIEKDGNRGSVIGSNETIGDSHEAKNNNLVALKSIPLVESTIESEVQHGINGILLLT